MQKAMGYLFTSKPVFIQLRLCPQEESQHVTGLVELWADVLPRTTSTCSHRNPRQTNSSSGQSKNKVLPELKITWRRTVRREFVKGMKQMELVAQIRRNWRTRIAETKDISQLLQTAWVGCIYAYPRIRVSLDSGVWAGIVVAQGRRVGWLLRCEDKSRVSVLRFRFKFASWRVSYVTTWWTLTTIHSWDCTAPCCEKLVHYRLHISGVFYSVAIYTPNI